MIKFESKVLISKPLDKVFAFLLDLENAKYFDPDVKSVDKINEGESTDKIGAGTMYKFYERTPPFGKFKYITARYTLVEPNSRMELEVPVGPLNWNACLKFEQKDEQTSVTFIGTAVPPLFLKLLSPLILRQAKKTWDKRLNYVKNWLEKE